MRVQNHEKLIIIIIIIMYIYHALINAPSAHMIHVNLNMIFSTHVEHSPTKTIYIKYYTKTHYKHTHTHMHAYTHTHTLTHTRLKHVNDQVTKFSVSIAMCQINILYGMKYGIEVMPTHIQCKMLMFCVPT